MTANGRGNPPDRAFAQPGIGMGMTFICSRCHGPKQVGGRCRFENGETVCAGCLTPAEVAAKARPRKPALKREPEKRVVLDWKAPSK